MVRFTISAFITAFLFWIALQVNEQQQWAPPPSRGVATLIFVLSVTVVIFFYVSRPKLQQYFLQTYLLSMIIKMIAACAYVLILVMKDKAGAFANVGFFLAAYLAFTALEIGFLYRRITGPGRRQ